MKDKIDKFLELNYDKMLKITKNKLSYYDKPYKPEDILVEAYFYVVNCEKLTDPMDIPKFMVNWINTELRYPKSSTNYRYHNSERSREVNIDKVTLPKFDELNIDLIDVRDSIDNFKNELDRIDQIVWRAYSEKGIRTIKELSAHFKIPESTINIYRTRILNKFKEYYENQSGV